MAEDLEFPKMKQWLPTGLETPHPSWLPKWKRHEKSEYWQKLMDQVPDDPPEPMVRGIDDVWAGAGGFNKGVDAWLKYGMKKFLLYETDYEHKVTYITLNRPEKLNAGSPCPASEAIMIARDDPDCKAIVVRGNGRSFCVGYDITPDIGYVCKGRMVRGDPGTSSDAESFSLSHREESKCDFYRVRIWDNPKPVIAAVHGYCIAGGNDFTTRGDLLFASPNALFGYNILRGAPVLAMHTFAPWLFGPRKSKEICFTGNLFSAEEMYYAGAINKVILNEHLEDYVDNIARHIASLPAVTISLTKRAINNWYDMQGKREYEDYASAMRSMAGTWSQRAGEDEYGSSAWNKATNAKGLSYHLRERGRPFRPMDAWWRQAVAARPKYETGTKEKGWDERPEVIAARKKDKQILEKLKKKN